MRFTDLLLKMHVTETFQNAEISACFMSHVFRCMSWYPQEALALAEVQPVARGTAAALAEERW